MNTIITTTNEKNKNNGNNNQDSKSQNTRQKVKGYNQAKVAIMAALDRFDLALNELETVGERKCYQGLGKAFLMRPQAELKGDYLSLIETNKKELAEMTVFVYFLNPWNSDFVISIMMKFLTAWKTASMIFF